jgi:hypothetical protein
MLYALCDRSSRSARPPGCARVDSRLDTAKIGSDGRVEVHRARLLAVFGGRKTFPHSLDPERTFFVQRQSDDGSTDCRATNDVHLGIALRSGVMQHLVAFLTRLNGAWNGRRCR